MPKGVYTRSRSSIQCGYKDARITMTKFLRCERYGLPSWLIVHHKDKNPRNNAVENLQIMTKKQHQTHHLFGKGKYGVTWAGNEKNYKAMHTKHRRELNPYYDRDWQRRKKQEWLDQPLTQEQRDFLLSIPKL